MHEQHLSVHNHHYPSLLCSPPRVKIWPYHIIIFPPLIAAFKNVRMFLWISCSRRCSFQLFFANFQHTSVQRINLTHASISFPRQWFASYNSARTALVRLRTTANGQQSEYGLRWPGSVRIGCVGSGLWPGSLPVQSISFYYATHIYA